ncbi:DUF4358 domain-containing protein [Cohnella zeiphila]|uniref:DUF4358 domain-containing protein n=1 Tax=Cohnella zeiphila TaxID=2761120 RepID=A0A7X0VVX7_9BACL|nr:DUF4358 domain-containing protein [Cohnella zeiphila]MBB6732366.1 DUF4358 domain-containing protein [Cohnella zeiphila]
MKLRGIVALVLTVAIGLLTRCSGRSASYDTLTAAEVVEPIQQAADFSEMQQGDAEKLRKIYHIEAGDVADFILYTAVSNVKADELAVIKVKDSSDTERVVNQIQQRIEAQTVKFQDYRPEQYYLIEKHVLKSKGPFVFFAVSKDADRMERAFDEVLR